MNYELAKKLEQADYYQPKGKDIFKGEYIYIAPKCFKSAVYVPTLEELIDDCGENFLRLERLYNLKGILCWGAMYTNNEDKITIAHDITKKGAVAKLWLKLNKK